MPEMREYEHFCKLVIRNMHHNTTQETLKSHFEQWGEVVSCIVIKNRRNNRSKGYGFVIYKHSDMVDSAQNARPHIIDNQQVRSHRAVHSKDSDNPEALKSVKTLFVRGIDDDLDEDYLRQCFGSYGNITNVNFVTDMNTGRRDFAFVEFDDYDPVDKIVLLERHICNGINLLVKKALPIEETHYTKRKKRPNVFGRMTVGGANGRRDWRTAQALDRGGYGQRDHGVATGSYGDRNGFGRGWNNFEGDYHGDDCRNNYSRRYRNDFRRSSVRRNGYGYNYSSSNFRGWNSNRDSFHDNNNRRYGNGFGRSSERRNGYGYNYSSSNIRGWNNNRGGFHDTYGDWNEASSRNFNSSHRRDIVRDNTNYPRQIRGHYGVKRGTGGYGVQR